jgi:hypothetical protein
MAHCGYEPTAANAAVSNPWKALKVSLFGIKTTGPMAPEIDLSKQRPAQYVFSSEVQKRLSEIRADEAKAAEAKAAKLAAATAQKASAAQGASTAA